MSEVRRSGRAVVVVAHDLDLVQRFCDRACLLVEGRIVAEGEPAEVVARYCKGSAVREPVHAV